MLKRVVILFITIVILVLSVFFVRSETINAYDDFECADFNCGTGWDSLWQSVGNCEITTLNNPLGVYHLRGSNGCDTYREFNLEYYHNVTLEFYATASSLESGEYCNYYYYNGSDYIQLLSLTDGDDDVSHDKYSYTLDDYGLSTDSRVRMEATGSVGDNCLLDNITISGEISTPPSIYNITAPESCGESCTFTFWVSDSESDDIDITSMKWNVGIPAGLIYFLDSSVYLNELSTTPSGTQYEITIDLESEFAENNYPRVQLGIEISDGKYYVSESSNVFPVVLQQDIGSMTVFGTEYLPETNGKAFLQFLDEDKKAINNSECFLDVYYPNSTIWMENILMNYADDGLYYNNFFTPSTEGVYMLSAMCFQPLQFGSYNEFIAYDDFETGTFYGGTGWSQPEWDFSATASEISSEQSIGVYSGLVTGAYGYIGRGFQMNLNAESLIIDFWYYVDNFQTSERMDLWLFGGAWYLVDTFDKNNVVQDQWNHASYTIPNTIGDYGDFGNMRISFDGYYMPSSNDNFFVDNLTLTQILPNITIDLNDTESLGYEILRGAGEIHITSDWYSVLNDTISSRVRQDLSVGTLYGISDIVNILLYLEDYSGNPISNENVTLNIYYANSSTYISNITMNETHSGTYQYEINLTEDIPYGDYVVGVSGDGFSSYEVFQVNPTIDVWKTLYKIDVLGTDYEVGDDGRIFLTLSRGSTYIDDAECYVNVDYPNSTNATRSLFIDYGLMTPMGADGLYYYDFTAPDSVGIYMLSVECDAGSDVFVHGGSELNIRKHFTNVIPELSVGPIYGRGDTLTSILTLQDEDGLPLFTETPNILIYYPDISLWVNSTMTEIYPGIYRYINNISYVHPYGDYITIAQGDDYYISSLFQVQIFIDYIEDILGLVTDINDTVEGTYELLVNVSSDINDVYSYLQNTIYPEIDEVEELLNETLIAISNLNFTLTGNLSIDFTPLHQRFDAIDGNITEIDNTLNLLEIYIGDVNQSIIDEINFNEAKLDIIDGVVDSIQYYIENNMTVDLDYIINMVNSINFTTDSTYNYLQNTIYPEIDNVEEQLNEVLVNTTNIWDKILVIEDNVTKNQVEIFVIQSMLQNINQTLITEINENEAKLDIIDGVVDLIYDYMTNNMTVDISYIISVVDAINLTSDSIYSYLQNTIFPEIDDTEEKLDELLLNTTNIYEKLVIINNNVTDNYNKLVVIENMIEDINSTIVSEINENQNILLYVNDTTYDVLNRIQTIIEPNLNQIITNLTSIQSDIDDITLSLLYEARVYGTDYTPGDNGRMFLQLTEGKNPINGEFCQISVHYPDSEKGSINYYIKDNFMVDMGVDGLYYLDFVVPSDLGIYMVNAQCFTGTNTYVTNATLDNLIQGSVNSGSLSDTYVSDDVYYQLEEQFNGGTNRSYVHDFYFDATGFPNVTNFTHAVGVVVIEGRITPENAETIQVKAYNWSGAQFVTFDNIWYSQDVGVPDVLVTNGPDSVSNESYFINDSGVVLIRLQDTLQSSDVTNNDIYIDRIVIGQTEKIPETVTVAGGGELNVRDLAVDISSIITANLSSIEQLIYDLQYNFSDILTSINDVNLSLTNRLDVLLSNQNSIISLINDIENKLDCNHTFNIICDKLDAMALTINNINNTANFISNYLTGTVTNYLVDINQTVYSIYDYLQNTIYPEIDDAEEKLDEILVNTTNIWDKLILLQLDINSTYNKIVDVENLVIIVNQTLINEINENEIRLINLNVTVTQILYEIINNVEPALLDIQVNITDMQIDMSTIITKIDQQTQYLSDNFTLLNQKIDYLQFNFTSILTDISNIDSKLTSMNLTMIQRFDTIDITLSSIITDISYIEAKLDCNHTINVICDRLDNILNYAVEINQTTHIIDTYLTGVVTNYLININQTVNAIYDYLQNTIYPAIDETESKLDEILINTTNIWDKLLVLEINITGNYNELLNIKYMLENINSTIINEINENENILIIMNSTVNLILSRIQNVVEPSLIRIENNITDMQIDIDTIISNTDTLEQGQIYILSNLTSLHQKIDNLQFNFTDIVLDITNITNSLYYMNLTMTQRFDTLDAGQSSIISLINDIESKLDCNFTINVICDKLDDMTITINNINTSVEYIRLYLDGNVTDYLYDVYNLMNITNATVNDIWIFLSNLGKFPSEIDLLLDDVDGDLTRSQGAVNITVYLISPQNSTGELNLYVDGKLNETGYDTISKLITFTTGTYVIKSRFEGDDKYAKTTEIHQLTITDNNSQPVVNLITPTENESVNLPYNITFSVNDNDLLNVSIFLYESGQLNKTIVTDLVKSDTSYLWSTSHPSGIYDMVLQVCELNTFELFCVNDTHQIYLNLSCVPDWSSIYGSCLIDDTRFLIYNDTNQCGTSYGLPGDNGTYVYCNYCSEDIQGPYYIPSTCPENQTQFRYYIDNNYATCCQVTSLMSDCSILYSPYTNQSINCSYLATSITLELDTTPYIEDRIPIIADLGFANATKCWSYVKKENEILQTSPQKIQYEESLLFSKIEESREYFEPVDGVVNAYYTKENLLSYNDFIVGVRCALSNGTILEGEQQVNPVYKDLRRVNARSVWGVQEIQPIIFLIVFVIIIILTVIYAWKR